MILEKLAHLPGDSHVHLLATGFFSVNPQRTLDSLGYKDLNFLWGWSSWDEFDGIPAYSPVVFSRRDGHEIFFTEEAVRRAGYSSLRALEHYLRHQHTGSRDTSSWLIPVRQGVVLKEGWAMWLWYQLATQNETWLVHHLLESQKVFLKFGYQWVRDMSGNLTQWGAIQKLRSLNRWSLRLIQNFEYYGIGEIHELLSDLKSLESHDPLFVGGVKVYLDGTLHFQTAASRCFSQDTCSSLLWEHSTLENWVFQIWRAGFPVCFHTIGDEAVTQALDVYETVSQTLEPGEMHLEHLPLVKKNELDRFRGKKIVVHMQPLHWTDDRARLPCDPHSLDLVFAPWRELSQRGIRIFWGSDSPIYAPNHVENWRMLLKTWEIAN